MEHTRNDVPSLRMVDVVTDRGVPFRVTFGKREYRDGTYSLTDVVSFYDSRYDHTPHGQFVSDYCPETMLERGRGYGLCLNGDYADWTIDAGTMDLVRSCLINWVRF